MASDQGIVIAFEQGFAANERHGKLLSDNPYQWGSDCWEAWREGFAESEGPSYVVAAK